jgi:hypothetical protein
MKEIVWHRRPASDSREGLGIAGRLRAPRFPEKTFFESSRPEL